MDQNIAENLSSRIFNRTDTNRTGKSHRRIMGLKKIASEMIDTNIYFVEKQLYESPWTRLVGLLFLQMKNVGFLLLSALTWLKADEKTRITSGKHVRVMYTPLYPTFI